MFHSPQPPTGEALSPIYITCLQKGAATSIWGWARINVGLLLQQRQPAASSCRFHHQKPSFECWGQGLMGVKGQQQDAGIYPVSRPRLQGFQVCNTCLLSGAPLQPEGCQAAAAHNQSRYWIQRKASRPGSTGHWSTIISLIGIPCFGTQ